MKLFTHCFPSSLSLLSKRTRFPGETRSTSGGRGLCSNDTELSVSGKRINIYKTNMCIKLKIRTQRKDKTLNVGQSVTKLSVQDSQRQRQICWHIVFQSRRGGSASAKAYV